MDSLRDRFDIATNIFASQNNFNQSWISIDLHGKTVREAKLELEKQFQYAKENCFSRIHIITGKGNHSQNRFGVLFHKTVPQFLEKYEERGAIKSFDKDLGGYLVTLQGEESFQQTLENVKIVAAKFYFPQNFESTYQRAMENSGEDQLQLFSHYLHGIGVKQDEKEAFTWLEKAADQGHQLAQELIGKAYENGNEVKQNFKTARHWYLRAIDEHESRDALFALGSHYWLGTGVIRDDQKAVRYLMKAADQGQTQAASVLGPILVEGKGGIERDPKKGCDYLRQAAKSGIALAQVTLGKYLFFGSKVEKNYEEAFYWFTEADKLCGDKLAQYYLGRMHREGIGRSVDRELAYAAFAKSAKQGDKDSEGFLAVILMEKNTRESVKQAVGKLKTLDEEGNSSAAYMLGKYYFEGDRQGLPQNIFQAILYLEKAANQENDEASYLLVEIALQQSDFKQAIHWLRVTVDLGERRNPDMLLYLARLLYSKGDPSATKQEIRELFQQAVELDSLEALVRLGEFYLCGDFFIEKDEEKGIALLKEAGEKGSLEAKLIVGKYLLNKESIVESTKGIVYLQEAAKTDPEAMYGLALCYYDGKNIPKDEKKFLYFLRKAVEKKHKAALQTLVDFYFMGRDPLAWEYLRQASKEGLEVRLEVARCYQMGLGTTQNISKAIRLLEVLSKEKIETSPLAAFHLAEIYLAEEDLYDVDKALQWLKPSLNQEYEPALSLIGDLLDNPETFSKSLTLMQELAKDKQFPQAQKMAQNLLNYFNLK